MDLFFLVYLNVNLLVCELCFIMIEKKNLIVNDEFFTSAAKVLDTESYIHTEFDDLYQNVTVINERYADMFTANGCDFDCLKAEFRILASHVTKFLSKSSPAKCWPQLFKLKAGLGLFNILHIAELCISILLVNAESE